MNKEIKELEEIRERITKIYMDLGNPDYVEADSVLNQDIAKLKKAKEDKAKSYPGVPNSGYVMLDPK